MEKRCFSCGHGVLTGVVPSDAEPLRQTDSGYECLMDLTHIGGLPSDTVTEKASINDVIVYLERNAKSREV